MVGGGCIWLQIPKSTESQSLRTTLFHSFFKNAPQRNTTFFYEYFSFRSFPLEIFRIFSPMQRGGREGDEPHGK